MNHDVVDESVLIEELPRLHELQLVDLRIGELLELRDELDDGSHKRHDLEVAERKLSGIQKQLDDLRSRQNDRQLEQQTLTDRREKNQARLWQSSPSPAEAEALQSDLQAIATRLDVIKIELDDYTNRIEPLVNQADDEQRTVDELKAELIEVENRFREDVKDIDAELDQRQAERDSQAEAIHEELLRRYELIRHRRGEPGVVEVGRDAVCDACSTQLTSYMVRQLQLGQAIQQCENCNTILYWTGGDGPILSLEEWREHPGFSELFDGDGDGDDDGEGTDSSGDDD